MIVTRKILHGHIFCGLGGGAVGFNQGEARVGNLVGEFECVGGIDVDPAACRDFARNVGVAATCLDLFTFEQYVAFHGRKPPSDWRPAVPEDICRAFGYRRPHILFLSAPCKGFSGLLSEATSRTIKYQALNELTVRGVWLALEAFKDDPVELILFENVPRIATRGRHLLDQIIALLRAYGYVVSESKHDCGELGNMAQSRKRFLLVARHAEKVPNFLYEPIRRPLRGVGEVIGELPIPFPGSEQWNPMHRMPSLNWKTWVRLAFVEAGSDWRSLNKLRVEEGMLADFGILPDAGWHRGVLGVQTWGDHSPTVTSRSGPTNGAHAVADPRVDGHPRSVQLGVRRWGQAAGVVTGKMVAGGGPNAVADPRLAGKARFNSTYRIVRWGQHSPAVAGPGGPAGGLAVADPRPGYGAGTHHHVMKVTRWGNAGGTITASHHPAGGALCVADPRYANWHPGASSAKLRVSEWHDRTFTVTGAQQVGSGALSVADPRLNGRAPNGQLGVRPWGGSAGVIAGESFPTNGAFAVADPRAGAGFNGKGKYRVTAFGEHAGTVISASTTGQGAFGVADPRPDCLRLDREAYLTGGHYGVVQWESWCGAIPGFAKNNNGPWSVGDPRLSAYATFDESGEMDPLPAADDRLVAIIQALDGTWHRPFTTLELAALQGLFNPGDEIERAAWGVDGPVLDFIDAGEAFALDGNSDSAWRERIGNCVPPPSAKAIAGVMGRTLLLAWSGETSGIASEPIWVRPIVGALMAAQGETS